MTARGGEILRFIGDAMLIVFPVTGTLPVPRACPQSTIIESSTCVKITASTPSGRAASDWAISSKLA